MKDLIIDTVVVGSGSAGLQVAASLIAAGAAPDSLVLLEASDRTGGHSAQGLQLVSATTRDAFSLAATREYAPMKVRWERAWLPFDQVPWDAKDWIATMPQWSLYANGPQFLSSGSIQTIAPEFVSLRSPVSRLSALSDSASDGWKLESADRTWIAKRVVWAAGIPALQNAYGKIEAQRFLVGNPTYDKVAADYRGGISLELRFAITPAFEDGFDPNAVFGLPVRHGGKLYLAIGVVVEEAGITSVRTLVHLPDELLNDPKELSSFQKSLKRGMKSITNDAESSGDRWVVSSRVGGHVLGTPWLLGAGEPGTLEFVGEESTLNVPESAVDEPARIPA